MLPDILRTFYHKYNKKVFCHTLGGKIEQVSRQIYFSQYQNIFEAHQTLIYCKSEQI